MPSGRLSETGRASRAIRGPPRCEFRCCARARPRRSTRATLLVVRRDEDLQCRRALADDTHAIPGDPRAQCLREAVASLVRDGDLQYAMARVLRLHLTDTAHLAERELEAMPI